MSRQRRNPYAPRFTHRLNERESNGVKYWETYSDPNHNNLHAETNGIEFMAFPYQAYYARCNNRYATVFSFGLTEWHANIYQAQPNGEGKYLDHLKAESKDEIFKWASQKLKEQ